MYAYIFNKIIIEKSA